MISMSDSEVINAKALTVCNNTNTSLSKDIKTSKSFFNKPLAMEKPSNKNSYETLSDVDGDIGNCLHTSQCSTLSNESDLSLALERDLDCVSVSDWDELPVFEIRELSPIGRTPSPIDAYDYNDLDNDIQTPTRDHLSRTQMAHPCHDDPNFVALHELDAQISPPSDGGSIHAGDDNDVTLSRNSSLETIFEGIFLNTPPRQKLNSSNSDSKLSARHTPNQTQTVRSRVNLLEKVAMNRLQAGKENQMPAQQFEHEKRNISAPLQARKSLADIGELTF